VNSRRYLALYLPWLPAERLVREGKALGGQPFALIEKQRGALRIAALNPQAYRLGLEIGQALADARGCVPEISAFFHDPAGDLAFLDHLSRRCDDYTPSVQLDPPQGLVLDVTGCAHLHGGEDALRDNLVAEIAEKSLTVRASLADTVPAARALARYGGVSVDTLPIAALEVEPEIRRALGRAGFRKIGDLVPLPRKVLAARFGTAMTTQLARLLAEEDAHLVPQPWQDAVFAEQRFAEPIGRSDDVLEVIEMLLERAAVQLATRGEGGRRFAARLHRSDGHVSRLEVETGAPTRDSALVLRLLRERIDSLADPLDPGFGYDSVDLSVPHSEALAEVQPGLEADRYRPGEIGPLLDRLAVRHSPARVRRFAAGNSHLPERAGKLRRLDAKIQTSTWLEISETEPPLRPLILLDPPQKVRVMDSIPDGPPRQFTWKGKPHRVLRQEGPERIAAEWWRRRGGHTDNPGLTRDYYRVEDDTGHRFWLFRHGLYGAEAEHPDWYVHGLFP
jgi:protein ImuB